ncbi:MAG: Uma2 family endonuclease [Acidobacteriaceae bacterium]
MATATTIPVETYLHSTYHPDCDFVDGEVRERTVGEKDHARLQKLLLLFFAGIEDQARISVYPELRTQVSPTRYRVPDITVLEADAPDEQVITHPPLIVIEILSPEDTFARVRERIEDYLAFGIPHIWIVDPRDRMGYLCTSGNFREWKATAVLSVPGRPITLDLAQLPA